MNRNLNQLAAGLILLLPVLLQAQGYKVSGSIAVGGLGGWDYLAADPALHRLYVSHAGEVDVIDTSSQQVVGKVTGMKRVHGIAFADDLGTGFISDGGSNQVFVFDVKTLNVKSQIPAGTNPDGIVYDAFSKRVFAFNGRSQNATVIDAATAKVDTTIALGGKPEFPISDGKGNIYDNIEDKNEIVQIDSKSLKVKAHWSISPCESPSGLAFDAAHRRLFAVCDNELMVVVDADTGKVVATPKIGGGPDAAAYDSSSHLAFSSNGEDGTVSVIRQNGPDSYSVVETVPTAKGSRTMALDPATHKLYLSSAILAAAPQNGPAPQTRAYVPGTFKVLVVSR